MSEGDLLTVAGSAELIRAGKVSCAELVESVLDRVQATEPLVSAYAHIDWDGARAAGRRADEELHAGRDRGPLHGIPVGIKDVILTRDMPTRAGSRVPLALRQEDAAVVARLRDAGCVLIGKHVTHEFACGQNVPPTRNPWDLDCYPGGSSAGAGASVAVGSALVAIGTDAGGSVRKPAALTGIVGLKPTFGLVSRAGVVAPSGSMDHIGIATRTTHDAALVLQAIAGDTRDAASTVDRPAPDPTELLDVAAAGRRVGALSSAFAADDDPPAVDLAGTAVDVLRALGAEVVDVDVPALALVPPARDVILAAEAGHAHLSLLREYPTEYVAETRRYLEFGALIPAAYLMAAYQSREVIRQGVRAAFEENDLDALVTPTTPLRALPLSSMRIDRDLDRYTRNTALANLTGLPAVTVPCGFVGGLPVGLQLIGRPFLEADLLGLAAAYERATEWTQHMPQVAR